MIAKLIKLYRRRFWSYERYARHTGVKIGKKCAIMTPFFGSEPYLVEIGDHVQLTTGVKIFTHGGGWVYRDEYPEFDTFGKVRIGNNVYVGNNALILPGVTIGNNVIIGAGAVVTKSIPDGAIVGGNPAKVISDVVSLKEKMLPYNVDSKSMNYERKKKFLQQLPEDRFFKK